MTTYNPRCGLIWRQGDTECIEVEVFEDDTGNPVADLLNYTIDFTLYNADGTVVFTKDTDDFTHTDNIFTCVIGIFDLDLIQVTGIYTFQTRVTDLTTLRSQSTDGKISVQVTLL